MIALTRRLFPLIGCSFASFAVVCGRSFKPQPHKELSSMSVKLPSPLHSKYYIHPDVQGSLAADGVDHATALPVLLLSASTLSNRELFKDKLVGFSSDDVFCDDFMTGNIVVYGDHAEVKSMEQITLAEFEPQEQQHLRYFSPEVKKLTIFKLESKSHLSDTELGALPEGPYFLLGDHLHQAWRLYPDKLGSFATTVISIQNDPFTFKTLGTMTEDGLCSTVAVPSRLYSHRSTKKPLAGMRISVKDNFRLKGIKTTQSNRAFVDTYEAEKETAVYLEKLIKLGAVIVGKTKLSAFASSEEATDQWIDFHPPFNPRADGYQSPSGSTSGGATCVAGYDWLDFSVGTDTSGSIRWPAAWNGLFGLRVTTNATSLNGVYPACRKMDTVGLLSRDLSTLHDFTRSTIEKTSGDIKTYPKKILYSTDFFPYSNKVQQAMIDEYVGTLEKLLGVQKTEFSIADRWSQCPPPEADGKPIKEFLNTTAFNPFYWDGYHEFDQFREDYRKKFGKDVYVGPYMRWKWKIGAGITKEGVKQSLAEWAVYEKWFHETILKEDESTGSTAVMILPCGSSAPKYRDDTNAPPGIVPAFSANYIASMIGLPQLVLPIGQFPYESRVSGEVEYLPVVGTLVGARGSDLMLLNLAKDALEAAKWPTKVLTGRFTFNLGGGNRYVASGGNGARI